MSEETKDSTTAGGASEPKRKRVQFDKNAKPRRVADDHPTKLRLGKANPWRELCLPFAVLLFFMVVCWSLSDMANPQPQLPDRLDILQTVVTQKAEHNFEKRGGYSAPNCFLYLAQSTIPGAGQALFAGMDYKEGDVVALPGNDFVPTSLEDEETMEILQYAFLIKHHHRLANVDGKTFRDNGEEGTFELRATKPIRAGEELFLPFSSHPKSRLGPSSRLFNFPGEKEFAIAEEMVDDMIARFRYKKGRETRGPQIEETLNLLYRTANRLNPMIASFMPITKWDMELWIKGRSEGKSFDALAMRTKGVQGLSMNARCLSYAVKHPQSASIMVARQTIAKGKVVLPVPLLVLPRPVGQRSCAAAEEGETAGECQSNHSINKPCLQPENVPFALCPLSLSEWISSSQEDGMEPNAEYRWNSGGSSYYENSLAMSPEQVAQSYTTQLSLDVVALRDIESGETLRVAANVEELIPEQWKMA